MNAVMFIAWLGVVLASMGPAIVVDRLIGRVPNWLAWAQVTGLLLVSIVAQLIAGSITLAISALTAFTAAHLVARVIEQSPNWTAATRRLPERRKLLGNAFLRLAPAFAVIAVGLAGHAQLYLRAGRLEATTRLVGESASWLIVGPALTVVFLLPFLVLLRRRWRSSARPAVVVESLVFALVNAGSEEVQFRAVPLALLAPHVGPGSALLMTAVLFGLGHWWGRPSGPTGVVLAGIAGLVWGQSILETGGLFWAWASHGVQDVAIFLIVASEASDSPAPIRGGGQAPWQ